VAASLQIQTYQYILMKISKLFFASVLTATFISCAHNETKELSKHEATVIGRAEFQLERLKDPATGKIPENIRMRELAFASSVPKTFSKNSRASAQEFIPIGPRNVGGRTRAISFHKDNPNIILAGGVSGGMWRSVDLGQSWERVTNYEDQSAVSCVMQDQRPGKSNVFYYGSGESVGNSASKSFSANYYGSGMYKSVDHGATWTHMPSTAALVQKRTEWSYIFNIAMDNSRTDKDILYAATSNGIRRSEDDGQTWTLVLGGNSGADYTNVVTTSTGVCYATISGTGSSPGFWRSDDGINWTNISPADLPGNHQRTLMAVAPSNENVVYFYSATPNTGSSSVTFWKYTYVSGNGHGAGGQWNNRTNNLPPVNGYSLNTQGSYCMSLAVKPDNENMVFLGGTNLFRSNNGFSNNSSMRQLGGYDADGYSNFDYYQDNQHPDQQSLAFNPHNPNELLAGTDGGLHFTTNPTGSKVIWQSFNQGYQTTQFYGIAIDHQLETEVVCSGYQDNGSWWTNSADTNTDWLFTMGADGSYCAKENGKDNYYFSSQNGNIRRVKLNANGDVLSRRSANPQGLSGGYLFVHPFILDPSDNNRMYLPNDNTIWRNSNLNAIDNNQYLWTQIATLPVSNDITAITASKSSPGVVYVGTRNRKIYKIEDNGSSNATVTDLTTGITSGTYTSCIAVDPDDADKILVIYSNYNVISIWYTEDGGSNWSNVEGNLKGNTDTGVPPQLDYIGDGPSFRWARFIKTANGSSVLIGTSIGLFATPTMDGENTEWIQQASDVVGNVVIEQIDYRESDGFCVVGTHGAGAYKTYFTNNWDITSVENVETDKLNVSVYPNPVVDQVWVAFNLDASEEIRIDLMNANGQIVQTKYTQGVNGENKVELNLSNFAQGVYYVRLNSQYGNYTKTIMK